MAKKLKLNEAAALHWAQGAFDKQDVPVGEHDVGGHRIVIVIPDGARVMREIGELGDGFDPGRELKIGLVAVLLFLQRCEQPAGPAAIKSWQECIKASMESEDKPESLLPREALEALEKVQGKLQNDCAAKRRTPAKRMGMDLVKILIEKA